MKIYLAYQYNSWDNDCTLLKCFDTKEKADAFVLDSFKKEYNKCKIALDYKMPFEEYLKYNGMFYTSEMELE